MNRIGVLKTLCFSDDDYEFLKILLNDKSSRRILFTSKTKDTNEWKRIFKENYDIDLSDDFIDENFEIVDRICRIKDNLLSNETMKRFIDNIDELRRIFYLNYQWDLFSDIFMRKNIMGTDTPILQYIPQCNLQEYVTDHVVYESRQRDEILPSGYKVYKTNGQYKGKISNGAVSFHGNPNNVSLPNSIEYIDIYYDSTFTIPSFDQFTNLVSLRMDHIKINGDIKFPDSLLYLSCTEIEDVILPKNLKYLKAFRISNVILPQNLEAFICGESNKVTINKNLKFYYGPPLNEYPDLIHLSLIRVNDQEIPKSVISMKVISNRNMKFPEGLKYLYIYNIQGPLIVPKSLKLLIYTMKMDNISIPNNIETVIGKDFVAWSPDINSVAYSLMKNQNIL